MVLGPPAFREASINESSAYIADFVIGEAWKNKAFRSTIRHSCGCMWARCTATRKPSRSCTRQRLRMSAMVTLQTHRSIPRAKLCSTTDGVPQAWSPGGVHVPAVTEFSELSTRADALVLEGV